MKTFKQIVNEVAFPLDYLGVTKPTGRPHYGAFGTESPDFDIKNPNMEPEEAPYDLQLHTIEPVNQKARFHPNAEQHFHNIIKSADVPRGVAGVTYVPIEPIPHQERGVKKVRGSKAETPDAEPKLQLNSIEAGFSSLRDLLQNHLRHKADRHIAAMAAAPGRGLETRVQHVYAVHGPSEEHPDYTNVRVVKLKNRGFTEGSTLKWNPVTGGHTGADDDSYQHHVVIHNIHNPPAKTKTKSSGILSTILRRRRTTTA